MVGDRTGHRPASRDRLSAVHRRQSDRDRAGRTGPQPAWLRARKVGAIYAVQAADDGRWFGTSDVLLGEEYETALLRFDPPPGTAVSWFAGQILRVRVGPCREDGLSYHAAQVEMADGTPRRYRVTFEVVDLLLFDGAQMPLRRALTRLVQTTLHSQDTDPQFRQAVAPAAKAQLDSAHASRDPNSQATSSRRSRTCSTQPQTTP